MPKSYRYNSVPNRFSSHLSTSPTNAATFVSRGCGGYTRHPIPESRTQRLTRRNRGLPAPRPQQGFSLPAKSLCYTTRFRHAFIYIHFPVLCDPSLSATALPQTIFHHVFQLLSQTPHVRFHRRKRVHTRLSEKDRTQRLTRRNRGVSDGGGITTLGALCVLLKRWTAACQNGSFAVF